MPIEWLIALFFLTAALYSSVGFGGGSTYTALLVIGAASLTEVPVLALACNVLVVAIGTLRFVQGGHVDWKRITPLVALSVPFAWLGGYLAVPAWLYVGLLAIALFVAGLLMLFQHESHSRAREPAGDRTVAADASSGAALGLLAGVTGIGGGIYLAPLLHLRRWAGARAIAATCAVFILVNSLAGLAGHATRLGSAEIGRIVAEYWVLLPAVALGGFVGSTMGSKMISPRALRLMTALLILYVAVRLGLRFPEEWAAR